MSPSIAFNTLYRTAPRRATSRRLPPFPDPTAKDPRDMRAETLLALGRNFGAYLRSFVQK